MLQQQVLGYEDSEREQYKLVTISYYVKILLLLIIFACVCVCVENWTNFTLLKISSCLHENQAYDYDMCGFN